MEHKKKGKTLENITIAVIGISLFPLVYWLNSNQRNTKIEEERQRKAKETEDYTIAKQNGLEIETIYHPDLNRDGNLDKVIIYTNGTSKVYFNDGKNYIPAKEYFETRKKQVEGGTKKF